MAKIKRKHPRNRQNKVALVFDETKRREFLTGFHKRKLQRKKKAQEELQQQLKEEKKRLKADAKESYKKLVVSSRPIPELQELLRDEYEEDNVTVKVVELNANKQIETEEVDGGDDDEVIEEEEEKEEIPGMELKQKKIFHNDREIKKELKKQATRNVKKSKVFQRKNKIERQKQKKKSLQQKKQNSKFLAKHKKQGKKQRVAR